MLTVPRPQTSINKFQFVYHFLPHPHHKRRATLLSHFSLFSYTAVLALFFAVTHMVPKHFPGVLGYASDINSTELLKYTNERRATVGLSALVLDEELNKAAAAKASDMFKEGYWAHVSPKGLEPWYFIINSGYDYTYAGENLAKNFTKSKDVVAAWYESPTHRENLLNSHYQDVGFAVVNGTLDGYETTIVVQMFGKRRGAPQVANASDTGSNVNGSGVPVTPVVPEKEELPQFTFDNQVPVYPVIDLRFISIAMLIVFGTFVSGLLTLDMWYSRTRGVVKINGHTFAHLTFLVLVIASVLIFLSPGSVL